MWHGCQSVMCELYDATMCGMAVRVLAQGVVKRKRVEHAIFSTVFKIHVKKYWDISQLYAHFLQVKPVLNIDINECTT